LSLDRLVLMGVAVVGLVLMLAAAIVFARDCGDAT
jgi:hypothetical protein